MSGTPKGNEKEPQDNEIQSFAETIAEFVCASACECDDTRFCERCALEEFAYHQFYEFQGELQERLKLAERVVEAARKEKRWNCWKPKDDNERREAEAEWQTLTDAIKAFDAVGKQGGGE